MRQTTHHSKPTREGPLRGSPNSPERAPSSFHRSFSLLCFHRLDLLSNNGALCLLLAHSQRRKYVRTYVLLRVEREESRRKSSRFWVWLFRLCFSNFDLRHWCYWDPSKSSDSIYEAISKRSHSKPERTNFLVLEKLWPLKTSLPRQYWAITWRIRKSKWNGKRISGRGLSNPWTGYIIFSSVLHESWRRHGFKL